MPHPEDQVAHQEASAVDHRVARTAALVAAVAAGFALAATVLVLWRSLVLAAFLAILLAVAFHALAEPISKRTRLDQRTAVVGVMIVFFGVLVGAGMFLGDQVAQQFSELVDQLDAGIRQVRESARTVPFLRRVLEEGGGGQPMALVGDAVRLAGTVTSALTLFVLVLLMSVFFAYAPRNYLEGVYATLPERWNGPARRVASAAYRDLHGWLAGQLLTMTIIGTFVTIGLWIAGVSLAPALGLLSALVNFIPYLGPFLGAAPGILVVVGEGSGGPSLWVVVAIYAATQALEGWIVTPLVQKNKAHLEPALLLFFQVGMGIAVGALGVVVATPLLVVVRTVLRELGVVRRTA